MKDKQVTGDAEAVTLGDNESGDSGLPSPTLLDAVAEVIERTWIKGGTTSKDCAQAAIDTMNDHLGYTPEQVRELASLLREASDHTGSCHDCICLTGGDLQSKIDAILAVFTSKGGV